MFTSIDENALKQAIRKKDYLALKISTVSTMLDDPTFERGETNKLIQILNDQVPEIFEKEVKLDYEEKIDDESKWDKRYFTKLTYWFQENFAISRIAYIKKVGKVVHKDTAQQYNRSLEMSKNVELEKSALKDSIHTSKNTRATASNTTSGKSSGASKVNFPVAGAIVAVGALVLVGILISKLL